MNDDIMQWVGASQTVEATLSAKTARLMQGVLDRPAHSRDGEPLPPGWHWLYFHEPVRHSALGPDGHAALGGFLPPVEFGDGAAPRRMWAGGALAFHEPLRLGDRARKHSTVRAITPKSGRSGRLVFVEVAHDITVSGQLALSETQTLVYKQPVAAPVARTPSPAPVESDFSAAVDPDPVLLFRYSALTYNAHRIHYDADYCRDEEGYPGLVVHGPLIATLLLDLFGRNVPHRPIRRFTFRGRAPLFAGRTFTVNGQARGQAWAANDDGALAMSAEIGF